jgi:hypothetical protein
MNFRRALVMLLSFQKAITQLWQSLLEVKMLSEAKRGVADAKFKSTNFNELWTHDTTL